jgi:hypothetical protein
MYDVGNYRIICSNCGDDFKIDRKYNLCNVCHYYEVSEALEKMGMKCYLQKPKKLKPKTKRKFFSCIVIEEE